MREVIVILGAWIAKDPTGQWFATDFHEGYKQFGLSGHRIRILGGYYLHNLHPKATIVASGGKGKFIEVPDAPPVAHVIKKELLELGVPQNQIIVEDQSASTFEQLMLIPDLTKDIGKIWFVSNTYHLPRIQAFLNHIPKLRAGYAGIDYSLVSADDIVSQHDRKIADIIAKVYESPEMKAHIQLEEQGIADLKAGRYKF